MFRDEYLTYEGANSFLRSWRPESNILYELLFAALVTVFVYQVTKLILEVALGQRRRGEMLVSDLYIYMIVSGLSLSSIISSFRSKKPYCDEETYGDESSDIAERCTKSGRTIWVLGKYLVLLLLMPSIHIVGIFLSMEAETDLSFKDLDFGGLAMGIRENTSGIRMKGRFNGCEQVQTQLGQGEVDLALFFRCESASGLIPFDNEDRIRNGSFIAILRSGATNTGVTIVTPGKRWISFVHLDIHDGTQPYFLKNIITAEQRSRIFESGVRRMVAPCQSPSETRDINITWVIPPPTENEGEQIIQSVLVECAEYDENLLVEIANGMLTNVTFVQTERFDVSTRTSVDEFVPGDDFAFVRRRASNVSLIVMAVTIACVLVARFVVQLVLSIEGSFALDVILKDQFGLNCCDSMLQYEQLVYYGRQRELHLRDRPAPSKEYSGRYSDKESGSSTSDLDAIS